jgi:hypothetical protein
VFTELVRSIADGLRLRILGPSRQGLVVVGDEDGPFAMRLDEVPQIRSGSRTNDRLLVGLVLIAIAAYAYPTGTDLTDSSASIIRPRELAHFISRAATPLLERATDDDLDRRAAEAARTWLELPPVLPGERGRLKRDCQLWYTKTYLSWLEDQGRARVVRAMGEDSDPAYQLTDRFRLGITDVADHLAFTVLAEIRLGESTDDPAIQTPYAATKLGTFDPESRN